MDLSTYTTELRDNLTAAASLGDDATRRAAGAVAAALEPSARLALMHALSDLAAEVTRQLSDGPDRVTVDVRLDGRDLQVVAARAAATAGATDRDDTAATPPQPDENSAHERTFAEAGGDLTRTTVRMFNELKGRAEKAAAEQGVSLNSFISRAVAESIKTDLPRKWKDKTERHDRDVPRGETINGWVRG